MERSSQNREGKTVKKYSIYMDRQGGAFVYWAYSDGERVYLPLAFVARENDLGRAIIVKTAECMGFRGY